MRQIVCDGVGPASVMQLVTDAAVPQPSANQVRIRVRSAGVNRPDLLQRMGLYPPPADASPHLGLEVAGHIDACGEAVSHWQTGDPVCALVAGGGYAEFVCVDASHLMRVPAGVSLIDAAALPETCMTVWANVFERGGLSPGEILFVHAGASSIGLTAIAMAKAAGAVVLTTVGSTAKADACRAIGADAVFVGRSSDWPDEVAVWLKARARGGLDVVLDMLGGAMLQATLPLMAVEGRIASIAQLEGSAVSLDLTKLMVKRLSLTGSTLRARSPMYKAHLARCLQDRVWPQIEAGKWRPVVHARMPVEQVQQAHEILERRENMGKVLLTF